MIDFIIPIALSVIVAALVTEWQWRRESKRRLREAKELWPYLRKTPPPEDEKANP